MSRSFLSFVGVRRTVLLAILLVLMTGWTATAFAQTSAEGQYASPTLTPSGNPAEFVGNFTGPESFTNIEGENVAEEIALGGGGVQPLQAEGLPPRRSGAEEVALGGGGGPEEAVFGGGGGAEEVAFGGGGGGSEASGGGSGASESGGGGGVSVGVLPATGGPLTLFVVLGILALGSTGLFAFRRVTYR